MLIRADARAIPLRDACVACVVTSPPYFGLRDYGTARWDGGDLACDHVQRSARGDLGRLSSDKRRGINPAPVDTPMQFRGECPKCGAISIDSQIGLEATPDAYVAQLVAVFREVWRVLADDGVAWVNLGDSYVNTGMRDTSTVGGFPGDRIRRGVKGIMDSRPRAIPEGLKTKDLLGIPWRVAFALQADGWYLRSDIIWHKPNPMPESVTDRPTKAHEYLFLLAKSERYFYDADAIRESLSDASFARWGDDPYTKRRPNGRPTYAQIGGQNTCGANPNGRNKRSVWTVPTMPYAGAHFATMPEALVEPCILAGCPMGGLVLDPFVGSGTVIAVASRLGRRAVGVDLAYHNLSAERTAQRGLAFSLDEAEA